MSLISEALKKARQEAARQDALRPGVPYAVGAATNPPRRNPFLPVLAGLGAGCLVAGLLFAVTWTAGWGPFARTETSPAPQVARAPAAPAMPPAVEVREETPANLPAAPPVAPIQPQATAPTTPPPAAEPRPAPAPVPSTSQAAAPEAPVVRITPAAPPPAPPPAETAPAEENRPEPAAPEAPANPTPAPSPAPASGETGGLVDGQVYSGEVPVPGGGSVKLNGIAFSQDHPVAVLDGRVMGPGESIQGFTVIAIESGRVKLQGHGVTVYLSPK